MLARAYFGLFCTAVLIQAASPLHVSARYPVPGTGGWDYITLDNAARRLYVSHGNSVNVLEADTGKPVGEIPDTPGVHGIAIATDLHHGFTSNGRENTVTLFDPETLKVIRKIDVGKGPDGIYYHAASKRVFTCNHGSHDITALDASSGKVAGTLNVGGDGEQMITGRDGLIYVNLEDTAEVVAFDPKALTVRHRYPIGVAKTPTGLAYDGKSNRLFIMCRETPTMVVMDAGTGKVITSMPIGGGVDWGHFDPASGQVFASCGDGTLNVFRQKSSSEYEDAGSIKTQQSAKTMAFDPKTGAIYLPAGEFDVSPATEPGKRPQRTVRPGSFVVLVVTR